MNTKGKPVMSNAELRRAICDWLFTYNDRDPRQDDDYDVEADYGQDADRLILRITALSSQDDVRGSALEEARGSIASAHAHMVNLDYAEAVQELESWMDKDMNARLKSKPAAPVVECAHNWTKHYGGGFGCTKCPAWVNALPTPPAQDAPQSLADWFIDKFPRLVSSGDYVRADAVVELLRELDRRQGAK